MILTRIDTAAALELPDDLYWEDEHATLVRQSVEPGLTGAALIQEGTLQYRPMTLRAWSAAASWIPRATLDALSAWANVPGLVLTLARLGATYSVRFRYDTDVIDPDPVQFRVNDTADSAADPSYRVTLRLWILG